MRNLYFTKAELTRANDAAIQGNFNRAIDQEALAATPEDTKFRVTFAMAHHHKMGEPVDEHRRVAVDFPYQGEIETAFVDVSLADFNAMVAARTADSATVGV